MQLNDFLTKHAISMAEFAKMVGTTTATVSRIADGSVMPRKALIVRIHEVTGGQVTPNDLTGLHAPKRSATSNLNQTEEEHS